MQGWIWNDLKNATVWILDNRMELSATEEERAPRDKKGEGRSETEEEIEEQTEESQVY